MASHKIKGWKVYLEPRSTFDKAIIDQEEVIYCELIIIDVLVENGMTYIEALDFYSQNIFGASISGLKIIQHMNQEEEVEEDGKKDEDQ